MEATSLAALEAAACGKPVVATERGGPREIVVDAKAQKGSALSEEPTGLLVPPQDPKALAEAVSWLLKHPQEARAMGQAGRKRVLQHFDQRKVAAQIVQIYREVLAERRMGP